MHKINKSDPQKAYPLRGPDSTWEMLYGITLHLPHLAMMAPPIAPVCGVAIAALAGGDAAVGGARSQFALLRKLELPSFGGKLHNFPVFEANWWNRACPMPNSSRNYEPVFPRRIVHSWKGSLLHKSSQTT